MLKINVLVKNIKGLKLPYKPDKDSAGYDVYATSESKIQGESLDVKGWNRIDYIEYGTNLYACPQEYERTMESDKSFFVSLRPRSSISKYNLTLANSPATIDKSYSGQIFVRFKYLWQPEDLVCYDGQPILGKINKGKIYKKGDRICQLLLDESYSINFKLVDKLNKTKRENGGFGSTGE